LSARRAASLAAAALLIAGFFAAAQVCSAADPDAALQSLIAQRSRAVVEALKIKDMARLAQFVDPRRGLRLSPHAFIDDKGDKTLSRAQIQRGFHDKKTYHWGAQDGSGDPIRLTFSAYFQKYIYDADFAAAPEVAYNRLVRTGNAKSNLAEVYPGCRFVEYHIPQRNPEFEGMDWRSLRLIFQKSGDGWFLTGIVHDQWTI
jgi:hypothetical protein